ncbi:MAG: hypothetical protein U9Q05_10990, partial [Thermodesulfobacteriota bacterium]|nr:hypothetical protein [Thermodesulfobacteriota bacterium]
ENNSRENRQDLTDILDEVRIEVESMIVADPDRDKIVDISSDASMVYLPFRLRGDRIVGTVSDPLEALLPRLPTTVIVLAAEDIDLDAEPEEGIAAEMAAARDTLDEAARKAENTEKAAGKAGEIAEAAKDKVTAFQGGGDSDENQAERSRLEDEVRQAEIEKEKAFRKAAKAQAKARDAEKTAADLGVETDPDADRSSTDKV